MCGGRPASVSGALCGYWPALTSWDSVSPVVIIKLIACIDNVPKHRVGRRCKAVAIGLEALIDV
jgi:hypothetical protein